MSCGRICSNDTLRGYNARSGRNTRSNSVVISDYIARQDRHTRSDNVVITSLHQTETQGRGT